MANGYVQYTSSGIFRLVVHVSIPAGNNAAGLPWRTAVLRYAPGAGTTVLPDGDDTLGTIGTAEKTNVVSGAVLEVGDNFDPGNGFSALTNGQKAAVIDTRIAAVQSAVLAALQRDLNYSGFTR